MGLKESKKYAIGSLHENGGGKFEIIDRWFEEETDTIMLKYKFLENGRIETNKEINVNASEWKWRKVRGLAGATTLDKESVSQDIPVLEAKLDKCIEEIGRLNETRHEMGKQIAELIGLIKVQQKQIDQLVGNSNIINKLLEKI